MDRPFYEDILLVLILTLVSLICLLISALNLYPLTSPFIYIPYILLLIFLPGYSILAANNPLFGQNSVLKRVILSVVVSSVISILLALLLTYTPLIVFNNIIVYIVGAFTIILSLVGVIKRRRYHYVHFLEPEQKTQEQDLKIEPQPLKIEKSINKEHDNQDQTDKIPLNSVQKEDTDKQETYAKQVKNKAMKIEKQGIKPEKLSNNANPGKPNPGPKEKPPKRFAYTDLVLFLFLTILCMVFVLEPGLSKSIFNGIMGLFLMLFLPGYALIAMIYPKKNDLNTVTRLVLSFGLSYFLTSVIGLGLNYTPIGNNLNPILLSLSVLSLIFFGVALWSRWRIPQEDRFSIKLSFAGNSRNRNILAITVIIVLALVIATPAYNLMKPAEEVKFTEFYVQGPDGNNISNYPTNLTSGENGTVTIVLVNHEKADTTYQIVTTSNRTVMDKINVTLKSNEKKEIQYNFTAGDPGTKKLEFLLYKLPNLTDVYLSQSFWVNIIELVTETTSEETSTDTTTDNTQSTEPTDTEPTDNTETDQTGY